MSDRTAEASGFLQKANWQGAQRAPLSGDASDRRYERLSHPLRGTAVLMDAPPAGGSDTGSFVEIAAYLRKCGFSAPRVIAQDIRLGFLLLEDLGDALYARVLEKTPSYETALYEAAVDVLVELHRCGPPAGLGSFRPEETAEAAALVYDWYYFAASGRRDQTKREQFRAELETVLDRPFVGAGVVALRDYHAENLVWIADRPGLKAVGLLDFQDAFLGSAAYDLASLMSDARRDVSPELRHEMVARYVAASGCDGDAFRHDLARVGAQRNLRILGVFARLSLAYGKSQYISLLPRVWDNLMIDLADPALRGLRLLVTRDLPAPDPATLRALIEQCATHPAL